MEQPELGKMIADFRKAKGLTQDELVKKCNLSVRTLQRIESGDVTPRSFTIRTIFTALDYELIENPSDEATISEVAAIVKNDRMYVTGTNNGCKEIWKKVSD